MNGFGTIVSGTDDFNLVLAAGAFGSPSRMRYSTSGAVDLYVTLNSDSVPTNVTFNSAVVPLPGALSLLLDGLILIGSGIRHRSAR